MLLNCGCCYMSHNNCNGFCRKPEYCPEKGGVCLAVIDIAMREAKDEINFSMLQVDVSILNLYKAIKDCQYSQEELEKIKNKTIIQLKTLLITISLECEKYGLDETLAEVANFIERKVNEVNRFKAK